MTTSSVTASGPSATREDKGLKSGALGLISSTVVGVASTAPAYSLAATLGFVVATHGMGVQAPIVAILAFIPIFFIAVAYKELNAKDPDCGTTFTWGARTFGPTTGWFGGWGIVIADILVMASLAQIAGQYVFLLFNTTSIGANATSGWVLVLGLAWIAFMTFICYVGIEVSANFQKVLLSIELIMLTVLSVTALVKVANGSAPPGHLAVQPGWFNPLAISSPMTFIVGTLLMVFIYWGWDTTVSVNEETGNPHVTPGRAAVLSTFILLATYALVITATQSFAGIGTSGIGLGNTNNQGDVLSVLGTAVFGHGTFGNVLSHLLLVMVLSSAAASTQTTILPTARTVLAMGVYRSVPKVFARTHRRFLTPTWATVVMGMASMALYAAMNYISAGTVIADSVSALGVMIAFYYGLTGFECVWWFRHDVAATVRARLGSAAGPGRWLRGLVVSLRTKQVWVRAIMPMLGGLMLWSALGYNLWYYYRPYNSYADWKMPIWPHWYMGDTFVIEVLAAVLGVILYLVYRKVAPSYFRGEVLNWDTPTLVPEDVGHEVGMFRLDESAHTS